MVKLVCGVGVNDSETPISKTYFEDGEKSVWYCPLYMRWKDMLRRCYKLTPNHKNYNNYIDCTVCKEWLVFSNFREWVGEKQIQGLYLDKDLLKSGNKVYCPQTCVFVPNFINCLFTDTLSKRGSYPLGVHLKAKKEKHHRDRFQAYCHEMDKIIYLGYYDSPDKAHRAWQKQKIKSILMAINKYRAENYYDSRVEQSLLRRVETLENNILSQTITIRL